MARTRRFKVDSLAGATPGARLVLPPDEARHARVLRLKHGAALELFDGSGRAWRATLGEDAASAVLVEEAGAGPRGSGEGTHSEPAAGGLVLATAWPKGKRAAFLIEKCTELGVARIVPLRCARSVVVKDPESQGLVRLRRIAAEAAKQAGRSDVPEIAPERSFQEFVSEAADRGCVVLLDPGAQRRLSDVLAEASCGAGTSRVVLVGPEGGFTAEELQHAERCGARCARLAPHILRIETAAISACAVWAEGLAKGAPAGRAIPGS
jgi:16S rRNA (uracil1498-N3)-methyltransferase